MKDKFYLDIYCLPSMDYQDNVFHRGHPFSIKEYNTVIEKIYNIFRSQIQSENLDIYKSILRVADRYVITNVSKYLKYKVMLRNRDSGTHQRKDYSIWVNIIRGGFVSENEI